MHFFSISGGQLQTQEIENDRICTCCRLPILSGFQKKRLLIVGDSSGKGQLAVYCSIQCALVHHRKLMEDLRKRASRSFKNLVMRKPEEVRLLRILGEVKKAADELNKKTTHVVIN